MPDNVELNAGSGGAICATDDCGAAGHTQVVKLAIATDGNATRIPADAKGLQVQQPTAADLNVTVVGAVTANAGTNLNTSALAVEAGGNLAIIATAAALIKAKTDNIPADPAKESGLLTTINTKLVSGTDIGDVTINNAAGAAAVNVQDGGNAITVDGTVAATIAAKKIYQIPGTSLVFTETGGDATFTPKNVANGAGRVSNQLDLGAGAKPMRYKWEAQFKTQANLAIGAVVRIYLYASMVAASADLVADAAVAAETTLANFTLAGQVVGNLVAVGAFYASGVIDLLGRYLVVAMWNASGQALTNTNGDNKITMTPIPDELEA